MNLTLTVHLRIQFSDTAALKYQPGKEGPQPFKSWSCKGRFLYFRTAFRLFCGLSFFWDTSQTQCVCRIQKANEAHWDVMVQQRMSSRMMLLLIPSVFRSSNKQAGIRQGRGIKLVSTWFLFIWSFKSDSLQEQGSTDIFVISSYYFTSPQIYHQVFLLNLDSFSCWKESVKKNPTQRKLHLTPVVQISLVMQIWKFFSSHFPFLPSSEILF